MLVILLFTKTLVHIAGSALFYRCASSCCRRPTDYSLFRHDNCKHYTKANAKISMGCFRPKECMHVAFIHTWQLAKSDCTKLHISQWARDHVEYCGTCGILDMCMCRTQ